MILAIDPSTTVVGYAFGTLDRYVGGGDARFDGRDAGERCRAILEWGQELLDGHPVEYVAIEEPVMGRNARSTLLVERAASYLEALALSRGLKTLRVHPSQAKAAIAHGGAGKDEMIRAARLVIGEEPKSHHHADAVGVLAAAQAMFRMDGYG